MHRGVYPRRWVFLFAAPCRKMHNLWRLDDESRARLVDGMISFCVRNNLDLTVLHSAVHYLDRIVVESIGRERPIKDSNLVALACLSVSDKYHMDLYKGTPWFSHGVCDPIRLGTLEFEVCIRLNWQLGDPTPWAVLYTQWVQIHRQPSTWYDKVGLGAHNRVCQEIDASCKLSTALLLVRLPSVALDDIVDFIRRAARYTLFHRIESRCVLSDDDATLIEYANRAITLGHVLNGAVREIGGGWPELISPHRLAHPTERTSAKRARDD